jgi:dipeptide transport system permease protein
MTGNWRALGSSLAHLALPSFTLAISIMAPLARMVRATMLETLESDYVRLAWAGGLPARQVIYGDALRNALIPVITTVGLQVGTLLAGAILTETIFSWPGIGKWLVEAIGRRDYPAVQGGLLMTATVIIGVNLINPRIRHT